MSAAWFAAVDELCSSTKTAVEDLERLIKEIDAITDLDPDFGLAREEFKTKVQPIMNQLKADITSLFPDRPWMANIYRQLRTVNEALGAFREKLSKPLQEKLLPTPEEEAEGSDDNEDENDESSVLSSQDEEEYLYAISGRDSENGLIVNADEGNDLLWNQDEEGYLYLSSGQDSGNGLSEDEYISSGDTTDTEDEDEYVVEKKVDEKASSASKRDFDPSEEDKDGPEEKKPKLGE